MTYPHNTNPHREIGPTAPGARVASEAGATSGVIVFNPRPTLGHETNDAIAGALKAGDTVEKRVQDFHGCFDLDIAA